MVSDTEMQRYKDKKIRVCDRNSIPLDQVVKKSRKSIVTLVDRILIILCKLLT